MVHHMGIQYQLKKRRFILYLYRIPINSYAQLRVESFAPFLLRNNLGVLHAEQDPLGCWRWSGKMPMVTMAK